MRRLGDTVARLNARKIGATSTTAGRLVPIPPVQENPGALDGFAYVPRQTSGAALVVVLHGCSQTAEAYDRGSGWSRHAEALGFAVLFPQQRRSNNPGLCFNWFVPDDTARNRGEAASIASMIRAMVKDHDLDPGRVFITGLSAGGAMTATMLAAYPELFEAGAVIAGLPYGAATTMPQAFDAMRGVGLPAPATVVRRLREAAPDAKRWPRVTVVHGSADKTVSVLNAESLLAQWRGVHQLDVAPAKETKEGRAFRRTWTNAAGDVVVEDIRIEGMGHGTPLDISADPNGAAGPYMLDVGHASTLSLIESWRLGSPSPRASLATLPAAPPVATPPQPAARARTRPDGVREVIESALRKAGLLA